MTRRWRLFSIENTRGTVLAKKTKGKQRRADRGDPDRMDGSIEHRSSVVDPRRDRPRDIFALTRRMTSRARASTPSSPIVRHRFATAANAARAAACGPGTGSERGRRARARNVFARFEVRRRAFAHRESGVEAECAWGERRERMGDRGRGEGEGLSDEEGGAEVDARVTVRAMGK